MKKIQKCPNCDQEEPVLTVYLKHPEQYMDPGDIPDNRIYALTCMACGYSIDKFTVDNTLGAVKELRDEMDLWYGQRYILPIGLVKQ